MELINRSNEEMNTVFFHNTKATKNHSKFQLENHFTISNLLFHLVLKYNQQATEMQDWFVSISDVALQIEDLIKIEKISLRN